MDQAKKFRTAAAQHNRNRPRMGRRYPVEIRRIAVSHCRTRRESGVAYSEIADELGITALTLKRWLDEAPPAAGFRPIRIVEPREQPSTSPLTLIAPGGLRIEGLSWEQALEAVRIFS